MAEHPGDIGVFRIYRRFRSVEIRPQQVTHDFPADAIVSIRGANDRNGAGFEQVLEVADTHYINPDWEFGVRVKIRIGFYSDPDSINK